MQKTPPGQESQTKNNNDIDTNNAASAANTVHLRIRNNGHTACNVAENRSNISVMCNFAVML